jgi:hypothetical protein
VTQYTLTAVIIFFILEMIMTSSYSLPVLTAAIGISYTLAMVILGILAQRFFSWFRSNRNLVVGFYGLSSAMLSINAAFTFAFVAIIFLFLQRAYVYPYLGAPVSPFITSSALVETLNYAYATSSVLSFMLTWVSTILILRHYSPKFGNIKYWAIVGFPLAYFLIQFLPFIPNISFFSQSETVIFLLYTFIPTYSKLIGGILFGVAFWAAARSLGRQSIVKDYMIISGYGLVLLFVSNQAILLVNTVPYPPFGLATVSFMGLSSYMILVGIYCSAISVSEDSKLRQSIRNLAIKESKLLDSIGTAHMEQEIQKRVLEFTKRTQDMMAEETGIKSSMTEDDMKQYLEQVIREVKIQKASTNHDNKTNRRSE